MGLALLILFVLSSAAFAQNSNCAYTFTWAKYNFAFCVSQYGTLGMLQAPIGVDHLDPVNPIEGYETYFSIYGNNNYFGGCQVTNLPGNCYPVPAGFTEPNGPGTLPLIGDDGTAKTTFTANPAQKQVVITTSVNIGPVKGAFDLQVERLGVFQPGTNATFSSTGFGPYAVSNYGARLTSENGCPGNSPGAPSGYYQSAIPGCGSTNFVGDGTMFAVKNAIAVITRVASVQVEYTVF
jgi:carbon monoxide dehydrogenase subunit G